MAKNDICLHILQHSQTYIHIPYLRRAATPHFAFTEALPVIITKHVHHGHGLLPPNGRNGGQKRNSENPHRVKMSIPKLIHPGSHQKPFTDTRQRLPNSAFHGCQLHANYRILVTSHHPIPIIHTNPHHPCFVAPPIHKPSRENQSADLHNSPPLSPFLHIIIKKLVICFFARDNPPRLFQRAASRPEQIKKK